MAALTRHHHKWFLWIQNRDLFESILKKSKSEKILTLIRSIGNILQLLTRIIHFLAGRSKECRFAIFLQPVCFQNINNCPRFWNCWWTNRQTFFPLGWCVQVFWGQDLFFNWSQFFKRPTVVICISANNRRSDWIFQILSGNPRGIDVNASIERFGQCFNRCLTWHRVILLIGLVSSVYVMVALILDLIQYCCRVQIILWIQSVDIICSRRRSSMNHWRLHAVFVLIISRLRLEVCAQSPIQIIRSR